MQNRVNSSRRSLLKGSTAAAAIPFVGTLQAFAAGGVTPWGTWLTCEETIADRTALGGRKHGYVFEVTADPAMTTGQPIVGMGRFQHEAVAVDPATSIVYLTQDDRNKSGLYRFIPGDTSMQLGSLARGGTLQAARVKGEPEKSLITATLGDSYELEWVNIANLDADPQIYFVPDASGLAAGRFVQAYDQGALRMSRGEDGGGVADEFGFGDRLMGLMPNGSTYIFASNNVNLTPQDIAASGKKVAPEDYRDNEFAGACFDSKGHTLFVNIQTPGITFAIWGPWARGTL